MTRYAVQWTRKDGTKSGIRPLGDEGCESEKHNPKFYPSYLDAEAEADALNMVAKSYTYKAVEVAT